MDNTMELPMKITTRTENHMETIKETMDGTVRNHAWNRMEDSPYR